MKKKKNRTEKMKKKIKIKKKKTQKFSLFRSKTLPVLLCREQSRRIGAASSELKASSELEASLTEASSELD